MTVDQLLGFLQLAMFVKLFGLVLGLFYLVFVVVVYRQITLMTQILNSSISPLVKTLAWLQILAVGGLFFLAVVLL